MYALADCNNFYASCERVFEPGLKDAPSWCCPTTMDAWSRDHKKPKMLVSVWANPPSSAAIGLIVIKWWFGHPITRCTTTCLEGWCVPFWNFIPDVEIYSIDDVLDLRPLQHLDVESLSEPFESESSNGLGFPFRLVSRRPRRWPSWPIALPKRSHHPRCVPTSRTDPDRVWRWIRSMWEMFGVLVHAGAPSFEALASVPPWTWPHVHR